MHCARARACGGRHEQLDGPRSIASAGTSCIPPQPPPASSGRRRRRPTIEVVPKLLKTSVSLERPRPSLSGHSGASSGGHDAHLVFPDQFTGATGGNGRGDGGEHSNSSGNTETTAAIFSSNLMGNHMADGGGFSSSLYSSTETVEPPQMSATALLQKAAQMGATTSGGEAQQRELSAQRALSCASTSQKARWVTVTASDVDV